MDPRTATPVPISFVAADGYPLQGFCWRHAAADVARPVVVINAATSVRCRYYARFAAFLHEHGFDVVTYDYRGIGESRPASLKGFAAGWIDWGRLDFEAALQYALANFPGQPLQVAAHSVGGFLVGLAPSSHRIARVFTMGAQYAYWRDYARHKRIGMFLRWHVFMPALTALLGYFPGARLGWLEDTPRGVVRDWTARHPRFEENWRGGDVRLGEAERRELVERFAALRADTLAVSLSDDEFGTVAAIQRLLAYFRNSPRTHLHLTPEAVGEAQVGHFAFFHSRFEPSLWRIPLEWLQHGRLPAAPVGEVVTLEAAAVEGATPVLAGV
ncbi:alpha/beta fold hydrolase [Azospira restricta]|uniref:Alpha/beta fold hydrolase n=1 Tax=Azospira restricta TaxID=404405 RepID=A0A974SLG4_9RHOO|nr:alpha/beta fold hydrolase [Azospira restricta]QRJ62216.1 alpha/beta fold hydrolase [Azospira restricta]